ncbi:membrane protein [Hyphomicrobium nitrativorans NL23]|uniref:Membrane protein n=1 Tax=Hyphomicrobium nitrativorans NL23 TaxID=1029756 RepID=V5SEI8_9HYPH|nr:HPP family protein [Hyphomicrobium nitrativorans]AHB48364.1 membrane protein [Hyphomicrobium nitrativorans NL23]
MLKKNQPTKYELNARQRFALFVPILAGATLRERLLACLGALAGILLTALICGVLYGQGAHLPLIVAPIGASAVLLFAVPSSPLAQPWSIIGGNTISALVGVGVVQFISDPILGAGVSVSLAILAMSFARCLHPPGGAAALTAVVGGPAIGSSGFLFPFIPVGLNSLILVLLGIAFHGISRRSYPHVAVPGPINIHGTQDPPSQARVGFQRADVDAALALLDETFDIDPDDLDRLLRQVELEALVRTHHDLICGEVMSRDVISVHESDTADFARALLLKHNLRSLPVVGAQGRVEGSVGLRELTEKPGTVGTLMSPVVTALETDPAVSLVPALTDGRAHAAVIVDGERRLRGLITQTDLLAVLAQQIGGPR